MASKQVSLSEFLSGSVDHSEDSDKPTETEVPTEIVQRDDLKDPDEIDYTQSVVVSDNGNRYHAILYGQICACPHTHGEEVPLWKVVQDGHTACGVCEPVDYRQEQPDTQPTTVDEFQ